MIVKRPLAAILIVLVILIFQHPYSALAETPVPILVYHSIDTYKGHGDRELFVTPDHFERQMIYLKTHGYTLLTFEDWDQLNHVQKPIFITLDDGYKNNEIVLSIFKKLKDNSFNPKATLFVIADFIGRPNRLTKEDLRTLSDSGYFSVQSHTSDHPDLTKIHNLTYELGHSKKVIEGITSKPVLALSYPYGGYNETVIKVMKTYYQFGLTTDPGYVNKQHYNPYELPRIYVKNSTTIEAFAHSILKD
ncbi:polysaccharide deacetylase family protein [Pullulanibacillus sp. KACC 23026]|uniref:polysaccharide deacetylase family protein n=1 Tax=Pullulanibacillus sp. KACC 23026 TaxID=3028315 RepID=UPI0023AE869F|nr:polysaccharide deacetylase family protein [Pullulanibacillus sp. KACC 23026]WEG14767.1 polysaccharide deacetylase family protein [Pullulanibacillus sp. KACC 23026]